MVCAAGADDPLAETVAAPGLRGVDRHRAQRLAGHLPQLVAHIHRQRPGVGDLHGHALEFERDGAFDCQPLRSAESRQLADRLGEGRGVRHGAVSGYRLGEAHLPQAVVRLGEGLLDPAVLVAQRDFEMEHLFAVADEAESPRLDDSCMNRADIDLVQRRSVHRVEGVVVHRAAAVVAVGRETQRLGPRHAVEADAVALGDVAFEGVQGGVHGRQRG